MAAPPPFVGRQDELAWLGQALADSTLLVVRGAVGAGKTRLAEHMAWQSSGRAAGVAPGLVSGVGPGLAPGVGPGRMTSAVHVRCEPGDRAVAVHARAERLMDVLPGDLPRVLRHEARLLVIDDIHHLAGDDATRLLDALMPEPGAGAPRAGRLLVLTAQASPVRRSQDAATLDLGGLHEHAARDLWQHLESTYGPTRHHACDEALSHTRGMPLALRHAYARAVFGDDAWTVAMLPADARRVLEALAVLTMPVGPAALAALVPGVAVEPALIELLSRQLVDPMDPMDDGRFSIHEVVRARVAGAMEPAQRCRLERDAAALVAASATPHRPGLDVRDDGALGLLDPVDRVRAELRHLVAAGDVARAAERLSAQRALMARRGGSGELLGLVDMLEAHAGEAEMPLLRALRAELAERQGRVARAIELDACRDPVTRAVLGYRAGEVAGEVDGSAHARLTELARADQDTNEGADLRCRAAAALSEIELARGDQEAAHAVALAAFERDSAAVGDGTRALLHLALAAALEHAGHLDAARAALCRAASAGDLDPELRALVEARQAMCLAGEGRLGEAERVMASAERTARAVDAAGVASELRLGQGVLALQRGDARQAKDALHALLRDCRGRGDEIGALHAELALARAHLRCGDLPRAAELAGACGASARRRGLHGLAVAAALIDATIDATEMRLEHARARLEEIVAGPATGVGAGTGTGTGARASAAIRAEAALLLALVRAQSGCPEASSAGDAGAPETGDGANAGAALACARGVLAAASAPWQRLQPARLALVQGRPAEALALAREVAVRAERAGDRAALAEALALSARLAMHQGDRPGAAAAAARAHDEARVGGIEHAGALALLVLAALAMERGFADQAAAHARAAAAIAAAAGLPVERLVAIEAMDAIGVAAADGDGDARDRVTATMAPAAVAAAGRITAELGLTAARPYCMVAADGRQSFVADIGPERLCMTTRALAIDGVRELVVRNGRQVADLRRRTLLKRLLFLFARAPGYTFSKEEIVEQVWELEYHPLRHDAALFTNIMRLRRLLGEDGADLLRVSDDGYRFMVPDDYLYIEPASRS